MCCVSREHLRAIHRYSWSYRNTLTLIDEGGSQLEPDITRALVLWWFRWQFLLELFPSIKTLERRNPEIRAQILGPDLKAITFKCHQDPIAGNNRRSHALDELSCGHTGLLEDWAEFLGAAVQVRTHLATNHYNSHSHWTLGSWDPGSSISPKDERLFR